MVPLFLAARRAARKPLRVPLGLWYTHWNADRSLRLATRLADVVLSVDRRSFPLASAKVRGIGHAIDVERLPPAAGPRAHDGPLRLLALGRMTRAGRATHDARRRSSSRSSEGSTRTLEIRGPAADRRRAAHLAELEARRRGLAVPARARAARAAVAARRRSRRCSRHADALLSATQPRGSETLDKVVYEAGACGVPVLSSNAALDEFLGGLPRRLRFAPRDAGELARALLELAAAGPSCAPRGGRRAAAAGRRGPLGRVVGGRGHGDRWPAQTPRVRSSPWRRSPRSPRSAVPRPRTSGRRGRTSSRARRCGRSCAGVLGIASLVAARHRRARARPLCGARAPELVYGDPVYWSLLWETGPSEWLPFLVPITVLVFFQAGLYAARERRAGSGASSRRSCSSR